MAVMSISHTAYYNGMVSYGLSINETLKGRGRAEED